MLGTYRKVLARFVVRERCPTVRVSKDAAKRSQSDSTASRRNERMLQANVHDFANPWKSSMTGSSWLMGLRPGREHRSASLDDVPKLALMETHT